jgi:hypothetical protein
VKGVGDTVRTTTSGQRAPARFRVVDNPFQKTSLPAAARSNDQPDGTFVALQGAEDVLAQLDVFPWADCRILGRTAEDGQPTTSNWHPARVPREVLGTGQRVNTPWSSPRERLVVEVGSWASGTLST